MLILSNKVTELDRECANISRNVEDFWIPLEELCQNEPQILHVSPKKKHHVLCAAGDMYNQEGDATEPEWVKTEREQFTEFRDKNKDGKMDKDETRDWILPTDYDHAEAEAKHLVYESDSDKV